MHDSSIEVSRAADQADGAPRPPITTEASFTARFASLAPDTRSSTCSWLVSAHEAGSLVPAARQLSPPIHGGNHDEHFQPTYPADHRLPGNRRSHRLL